jgi:COMPASS component SWD3
VAGSVKRTYQGHRNQKFALGGCFGALGGGDASNGARNGPAAFIVSGSEDGSVVLWDVKSKAVVQRLSGHEGVVFSVDVHGDTMVSAGQDKAIKVYRNKRAVAKEEAANNVNGTKGDENGSGRLPSQDKTSSGVAEDAMRMEGVEQHGEVEPSIKQEVDVKMEDS